MPYNPSDYQSASPAGTQTWATPQPPQVYQRQAPSYMLPGTSPQMQQTARPPGMPGGGGQVPGHPYQPPPGGDSLQARQAYYDQTVAPYEAQRQTPMRGGGQPMGQPSGGMRPGMGYAQLGQSMGWGQQQRPQTPPWMQQGQMGGGMPQRPGMGYGQLAQQMGQQRPGGFPQMNPNMAGGMGGGNPFAGGGGPQRPPWMSNPNYR